jgi:hypothetical protein
MFGVDWSNPETLWINVTNLAMGLFVLLALVGMAWAFVGDLRDKSKANAQQRPAAGLSAHTFFEPELGLTMADGGEPQQSKPSNSDGAH